MRVSRRELTPMKRITLAMLVATATLTITAACGPGRQASWEKEATQKQLQPTPTPTPAPIPEPEQEPAPAPTEPPEQPETAGTQAAPEVAPPQEASFAEQADAAWTKRDERVSAEQAIALWENALETDPTNAEMLTRLARACYYVGDGFLRLASEDDAMLALFEKGVAAGERAMMALSEPFTAAVQAGTKVEEAIASIPPEGQAALYWYATNLGKFAIAKGFTTTLFYKDRIVAVMNRVLSIDETFFYGAPHRYFGVFYAKAPAFAGGDMEKSKEHFERALQLSSDYLGTKVLYAEFYATKTEDKELFTQLLNEVQAADPAVLPELVPEQQAEQQKAEFLLAQIDERF